MIEFDTFCYLQNQKTGCSFVEAWLRKFSKEDVVRYEKHRPAPARKPGKFYFVSVREPLDAYLSLFNYGLDGKGELFERLRAAGHGELYAQGLAGFERWLTFVLDPANAALVYSKDCVAAAGVVGLMSARFLRLASLGFGRRAGQLHSEADVEADASANRLVDAVIKYETMREELAALVAGPLRRSFADVPAAVAWLDTPRINPSTRRDRDEALILSDATRARMMSREWFLYRHHYSGEA